MMHIYEKYQMSKEILIYTTKECDSITNKHGHLKDMVHAICFTRISLDVLDHIYQVLL
jgi:hypothetical protein